MLRGRLAVASVHLCLACLLALRTQSAPKPCSKEVPRKIADLIKAEPNLKCLDCRLYTPTFDNYQQKCPRSTMKCFADEIQVLINEWEGFPDRDSKLSIKLGKIAQALNETAPSSECLRCERFKEETAEKFLRDLLSTLQMIYSEHCA